VNEGEKGAVTAQWIVCEQTGRWAVAIRGSLARFDRGLSSEVLRETRNLDQCDQVLSRWPASLVAVAATPANFPARVRWLACLEARFPLARVVVFSELTLPEADWALREAGAVQVVRSFCGITPVVDLTARHLARAPEPALSVTQQILARLPWGS
jgi:hypothetical protein